LRVDTVEGFGFRFRSRMDTKDERMDTKDEQAQCCRERSAARSCPHAYIPLRVDRSGSIWQCARGRERARRAEPHHRRQQEIVRQHCGVHAFVTSFSEFAPR
jgi:hypothetical protein